MELKFWHKSVVYQIYPKSFLDTTGKGRGDLKGVIKKLDYLSLLGIDVIWLSPVYASPMKDNGYDISDYQAIHEDFGTMEDMGTLIEEAHKRGIRIIMDLVVNHTSDQHEWFKKAREDKDSPYRDYYIWRDQPNDMKSIFGGSAWTLDETTGQYYFHQFAKEQPDLNWENEAVIVEVISLMNFWLEKGIGGFRMDVIDLIGKEIDKGITSNGPRLHDLLQRLNRESFGQYDVLTVGETWGASPEIAKLYSDPKRNELSMVFQFEHMTLDWGVHGKWSPKDLDLVALKKVMAKWQTSLGVGWNSLFLGNHDLPRIVSRWGDDKGYRVASAKLWAMILHMMKGTPYIFQGEEIGMTNVVYETLEAYDDVEIHGTYQDLVVQDKKISHEAFMAAVYKMGRDNARTPMQWSGHEGAGFTSGKSWLPINPNHVTINVEDALEDKTSIFYTYQKLIQLRKESIYSDCLVLGDFRLLEEDDPYLFIYERTYEDKKLRVVANISSTEMPYKVAKGQRLLSNYEDREVDLLRPWEALVLDLS